MNTRRDFLKRAAAAVAGLGLGGRVLAAEGAPSAGSVPGIGVILNTVAKEMRDDYEKTLSRLSEIGYRYIEAGRHYGPSVESFLKLLERLKLKVLASGTSMAPLMKEPQKAIDTALSLRAPYVVCYWPWMDSATNLTKEQCLKAAENLNAIGQKCKAAGVRLAMHNHDKEFQDLGGQTPCDILLKETQADLVTMELDLYWIVKGGGDPVEYFEKYPGRFEILHVKDMDKTPEKGMAQAVGEGVIDFGRIFAKSAQAGVKHYVVEHDKPEDGMRCAAESYRHIKRFL